MRQFLVLAACGLLLLSAAQAAEKTDVTGEPALKWFPGDCGVLAWPAAKFTVGDRAKQAADGGLTWMAVCNGVHTGAVADLDMPRRLRELKTEKFSPILALRWRNPRPISEDIIAIGVDPDVPLPLARAQKVIDWTNRLGGAAVIAGPGRKLERYVKLLRGFAAFEAFHDGKWNPECTLGGGWDKVLAQGDRIFIVGGTSEATRPVLGRDAVVTYVLARSNAERDIIEAIRLGRAVVAERDNIRLNFTVDGRPPGSAVMPKGGEVEVAIEVQAREHVDDVHIIGNTRERIEHVVRNRISILSRLRIDGKQASKTFTLRLGTGTRYLRAVAVMYKKVCHTMANPVFIGPDAPAAMPLGVREKHVRLVTAAIKSLDWRDGAKARNVLESLLDDDEMGVYTALALVETSDKKQVERIRPLLGSAKARVRTLVAFVLVRAEGAAAVPSILPLVNDPDGAARTFAARVLARFAEKEHADLVLVAARDLWPEVRQYALAALARAPSADGLFALRKALYDEVDGVSSAAQTQLSLALGVDPARQEGFIKAFKVGNVDDKLLEDAVKRPELRALVLEAARRNLTGRRPKPGEEPEPVKPAGPVFRALAAAQTVEPPSIDGKADDKAWLAALPAGTFVLEDGKPAAQQTSVRALYDKNTLYLFIECTEAKPNEIVANEKIYDGNIWLDDSVDIYICPDGARGEADPVYCRFSVNSLGVRFDEERQRRHWNVDWAAASVVGKKSWAIEVAIPFGSLRVKAPAAGKTLWLVNFVRHRRVKPGEESFFTPGDPRKPAKYADLKFQ
ncbi:MAG: HEAT repeat domain-containing protein [Planctomycetota bacterium]